LLVLIAVTNVYVFANGAVLSSAKNSSESKVLLGKLITNSNRPILVNGGDAITGTIILSGSQLITPAVGSATVQLDKLGMVMIAPSSSVTLAFDSKSVTVNVASGDATLTTAEGVKGSVIGPNGTPKVGGATPTPVSNSDNWAVAGVVIGSLGVVLGIWGLHRASNADKDAKAAAAAAAAAAANSAAAIAALKACLAGQTASPVKLCTSF
jgi:hypothetical protein